MKQNILLSIGKLENKKTLLSFIKKIPQESFTVFATKHTSQFLKDNKVKNALVYKVSQFERRPNLGDLLIKNKFNLIINIPTYEEHKPEDKEYTDGAYIRKKAVDNNVTLITDVEVAKVYLESLAKDFKIEQAEAKKGLSPKVNPFTAYYQPLYDINKSYDFNYEFGPFFDGPFPKYKKPEEVKTFLGYEVNSLFGVPAGPLLNSNWIKTYFDLGFDILTYKTIRTVNKACHQPPNIVFIDPEKGYDYDKKKAAYSTRKTVLPYGQISITNSFGVPSKEPDVWQEDIKRLLPQLKPGQLLILSVMGTIQEDMTEDEYVKDFVKCALLAKQAGMKLIEVNLSCPNLGAGAIFNDLQLSEKIVKQVKKAIGKCKLLVKIGYFDDFVYLEKFVKKTYKFTDAYVAINTVPKKVLQVGGQQALPGKTRMFSGTCGALIKKAGLSVVGNLVKIRKAKKLKYKIIGVGGVMTPKDYFDYRKIGVDAVQSATGAMWNPYLAYQIKQSKFK